LSYCWGEPIFDRSITCNNYHKLVTRNLDVALRRARQLNFVVIWADGVCIDQEDLAERASQVAMMGNIYSRARFAAICLGEEQPYTSMAVEYAHRRYVHACLTTSNFTTFSKEAFVNNFKIDIPESGQSPARKRIAGLFDLFGRPWFYRRWVVQGAAVSKRRIVYCGETLIDWNALVLMASILSFNIHSPSFNLEGVSYPRASKGIKFGANTCHGRLGH
jgi:hypothetical protein